VNLKPINLLFLLLMGLLGCVKEGTLPSNLMKGTERPLYSLNGKEYHVEFQALYRSSLRRTEDLQPESLPYEIKKTTQYLFGPLTYRNLGGIQKGEKIQPLPEKAYVQNDQVMVPYLYSGTWLLQGDIVSPDTFQDSLKLPLPYSVADLQTPLWQNCTDSQEGHNTWDFFWYYWEPRRYGCDHRLGDQYQTIIVKIGAESPQTSLSFPEYQRLIHDEEGVPTLAMTFAFGYIEDTPSPNPFQDPDDGMTQFQAFYKRVRSQLLTNGFTEQPIYQKDITVGAERIGAQFVGMKENTRIRVSVVAAAGLDPMDLFAFSYAKKHEGFFGWFGHSRVGSGFDAEQFANKLRNNPQEFSLTSDYQLVYWAGCNSYSYYTVPFFELKAKMNPQADPFGTRNLDLISNGLPSQFSFNAYNANVLFQSLLNWQTPTSYQKIVSKIENYAKASGYSVMVNVLGDEDNPTSSSHIHPDNRNPWSP
ncbi:MAG: hypothetical protein ACXVB1_10335, partial [Pseudobdellovibrionaceae bacterium]